MMASPAGIHTRSADPMKLATLVLLMFASVAIVAVLSFLDGERESTAALEDFAREQTSIAASVAAGLGAGSPEAAFASLEGPGVRILVLRPGERRMRTLAAGFVDADEVAAALLSGATSLRLSRAGAHALGLPERTALAGLARVPSTGGTWGVAAIATAGRERDRERRARWRLGLGVGLVATIVLAFGALALRQQRHDLRLEQRLAVAAITQERDEKLSRASRAVTMGTLASGVAHEVATPLGVIMGRAEQLLPRVENDERASRSVRAIVEQTQRIRDVIRGFLDVARGGKVRSAVVDPHEVVSGAVNLVQHRFSAEVTLEVEPAAVLPSIEGDLQLLQQVLVNLMLNACDACGASGTVVVRTEVEEDRVLFEVLDDGPGISPDSVARALEPFFTTKAPGEGTGLGLAIAHEIVKSHRGSLAIRARVPRGTVVVVRIPVKGAHES